MFALYVARVDSRFALSKLYWAAQRVKFHVSVLGTENESQTSWKIWKVILFM